VVVEEDETLAEMYIKVALATRKKKEKQVLSVNYEEAGVQSCCF